MTNAKYIALWDECLRITCHCYADEEGNRPCDNGCPCDECSADWVQEVFKKWIAAEEGK